ncbi:MAG: serine/threonine-protein kinase [Isosphaeraceae bacterium]
MDRISSASWKPRTHQRIRKDEGWFRALAPVDSPPLAEPCRASQTRIGRTSPTSLAVLPQSSKESGTLAATHAARAGRQLGPYRLIERIGRGRQADVWRARRSEPPGGEVALKVLGGLAASRDPRKLAQLRREAERGSRLTSPFLLRTYEYGEADGLAFLAMPLVEGCPLGLVLQQRAALGRGGVPVAGIHPLAAAEPEVYTREVVALLAKVARAVAVAHDGKVVHRDIKPMNILIGRQRERDHPALDGSGVYLCDFGLARDLDVATPRQLRDGAGSPLYMAPERLLKRPADEVRCDVYAMGVTLFESLALVPPFDVPPELPPHRWADFLANARPPALRDLAPWVSPILESVVQRAMEREPSGRHASALRLAYDLERVLSREA